MPDIKYNNKSKKIDPSPDLNNLISTYKLNWVPYNNSGGKIVLLTNRNATVIDSVIKNDPSYFPFSKIIFDYYTLPTIVNNTNKSLFALCREIDRDESTNVWRYNLLNKNNHKYNRTNFLDMINYIIDPQNDFFNRLKQPDYSLPDEIVSKFGTGFKSLSSKICKKLCEFQDLDNYYINDTVVRGVLLFYLDYYSVPHPKLSKISDVNNLTYQELAGYLDSLRDNIQDSLKKSELDHILWYCYKSYSFK